MLLAAKLKLIEAVGRKDHGPAHGRSRTDLQVEIQSGLTSLAEALEGYGVERLPYFSTSAYTQRPLFTDSTHVLS